MLNLAPNNPEIDADRLEAALVLQADVAKRVLLDRQAQGEEEKRRVILRVEGEEDVVEEDYDIDGFLNVCAAPQALRPLASSVRAVVSRSTSRCYDDEEEDGDDDDNDADDDDDDDEDADEEDENEEDDDRDCRKEERDDEG
eukprot:3939347-Rhodomonas_salina.2